MDNIVTKLFEAGLLSEEDQKLIQESFEKRVADAVTESRGAIEDQVRAEVAQRYEQDKSALVEAMDKMLTDVVEKYEAERVAEAAKLKEARESFDSSKAEMKIAFKTRLKEHTQVMEQFVMKKLSQELGDFSEDAKAVSEMRVKLASALAESRQVYQTKLKEHVAVIQKFVAEKMSAELTTMRKQRIAEAAETRKLRESLTSGTKQRIAQIDKFVAGKLASEIKEFHQDKRALVETRVKLIAEAREQLASTQRKFIAEAARIVDQKVTTTMKVEMKQLHEDLERNRQNMFGRRIFEAMAAEFMSSYYSEGTEVKKLEKVLESKNQQLATIAADKEAELTQVRAQLVEAKAAVAKATGAVKLAEDKAARTKVMSELLGTLTREKRVVMQELLESVKTDKLRTAFDKYLPSVLNEGGKKSSQTKALIESKEGKSCVAVTGDQRNNRLLETVQAEESEFNEELNKVLVLAGRKK